MSGTIESGTCDICKRENQSLRRMYFYREGKDPRYISYCGDCKPQRFQMPPDETLIEMAILVEEGRINKDHLASMVTLCRLVVDRLHEHGVVSAPSSTEQEIEKGIVKEMQVDKIDRVVSELLSKAPSRYNMDLLKRLIAYSDRYEISVQFWPEQTAVFIMKQDVDLDSYGGDPDEAIGDALDYLDRINKQGKYAKQKSD